MSSPESFPITVRQFLAETDRHLRIGDIILSRSPTFSSWLIRFATGSAFSHAALVFLVAKPEEGFGNTFVLESVRSGVGLAKLNDYVGGRHPHSEVVILRLEGEGLDEAYFKRVRGLMLDHVNAGYDFNRVMRMGLSASFGLLLGWMKISRGSPDSMSAAVKQRRGRRKLNWVPPQFICSGFIQYGLVRAANMLKLATPVVLKEGLSAFDYDGLLAVTPEDVARSSRPTWLYAIRRRWVHEVGSYEQARRKLRS